MSFIKISDIPDTDFYSHPTVSITRWENVAGGGSNYEPIRYFNCKRCGAVGQSGVCEYCGSAEE